GREKAESILGNHAVKICLNAANEVTAKYFSDLLGKSTVKVETGSESTSHSKETSTSKSDSYNYNSRQLMYADEIMLMPDNQSLLVFSNQRPIKAKKAFQFKLFPNADELVHLKQNDYQGKPEQDQLDKLEKLEQEWEQSITDKQSKTEEQQESKEELDNTLAMMNADSKNEEEFEEDYENSEDNDRVGFLD
ncbi:MAG: type IV secretory system conjugative DNA transfer family protein, partial [Tetragenococcus sp.]|nr:type IV secretory system conjugative DNA transfer family protein [Tetragenococcus sp.]